MPIRPMIIAINETWITDSSKGPYSKIKGYKFVQNNRHKNAGGGVAFYIANLINSFYVIGFYLKYAQSTFVIINPVIKNFGPSQTF